jgi:ANTAR domain
VSSHPYLDSRPADHASRDGHGPNVDGQRPPRRYESTDLETELEGLRQRLTTLPVIEQSKGLLIGHYGVDADTAFAILQRWSSHTNRKLREISEELVTSASRTGSEQSARTALQDAIQRLEQQSRRPGPR